MGAVSIGSFPKFAQEIRSLASHSARLEKVIRWGYGT